MITILIRTSAFLILIFYFSHGRAQESYIHQIAAGWDCTGYTIVANADGGYTIGGGINFDSIGKFGNAVLIKVNKEGIANKVKLLTSGIPCHIRAIAATFDSGYVAIGSISHEYAYRIFASKITSEGNIQWMVEIDTVYPGNQFVQGEGAVCVTSDSNFVFATSMQNDSCGALVVKLSQAGTPLWSRSIKVTDTLEGIIPTNVFETSSGGLFVTGWIRPFEARGMGILKLDPEGRPKWQRGISMPGTVSASNATMTYDGGIVICGNANNNDGTFDFGVAKVDSNGTLVWVNRIDGFDKEIATAVTEASDHSIAIGGWKSFFTISPNSDSLVFVRLNSDGGLRTFMVSTLPLKSYEMPTLIPAENGSVIALVTSYLIGKAHDLPIRTATTLIKIDSSDNVCNFVKLLCQVKSEGEIRSYSAPYTSDIIITSINPDGGASYPATTTLLCGQNSVNPIYISNRSDGYFSTIVSTKENIQIKLPQDSHGRYQLAVHNILSQIILVSDLVIVAGQREVLLSIPNISAGIYFLTFTNQDDVNDSFKIKLCQQ